MKKIVLLAGALCLGLSLAAQDARPTVEERVADALRHLPAVQTDVHHRIMSDLASTGEEGVALLVQKINRQDDAYAGALYALSGLAAYAAGGKPEAEERQAVLQAYLALWPQVKGNRDKVLVAKMIRRMGHLQDLEAALPVTEQSGPGAKAAVKAAAGAIRDGSVKEKCAALYDLCLLKEKGALRTVLSALEDGHREVRMSALNAFSPYADAASRAKIARKMAFLGTAAKEDILFWLGQQQDAASLDAMTPYIGNANFDLATTATWAVANIGGRKAMTAVANLLTSPYTKISRLGEYALLAMEGDAAGTALSLSREVSVNGMMCIMRIIAARRKIEHREYVFHFLADENEMLRECAYGCLKRLVTKQDLRLLYQMLEDAADTQIDPVKEAVMAAMQGMSPDEQYKELRRQEERAAPVNRSRYWTMLAQTGAGAAVTHIGQKITTAVGADREEAFHALLACSGMEAAARLLSPDIQEAGDAGSELALDCAIRNIREASGVAPVQKYLALRSAMDWARTTEQKCRILGAMGVSASCFPAVVYTGTFLENGPTQWSAAAALGAMLPGHPEYNSPVTRALARRVMALWEELVDKEDDRAVMRDYLDTLPGEEGLVPMFNGKDLEGWQGLVGNPLSRAKMKAGKLAVAQRKADEREFSTWSAQEEMICSNGVGYNNLCTKKSYANFEMYVEWRLAPENADADAGIYLRGVPQVQIWDTSRTHVGAEVGSGGLYDNMKHTSVPLCVADNPLGAWNAFYIKMIGESVTVYLNGRLVVDGVVMENYWDRDLPVFEEGPIELQAQESMVFFRNLYIKELPRTASATGGNSRFFNGGKNPPLR